MTTKVRRNDKIDMRTLISGLVILTICLIACIIHISDLYKSYQRRVRGEYEAELEQLTIAVDETLTNLSRPLETAAKEMLELLGSIDAESDSAETYIADLMSNYQNERYVHFAYISLRGTAFENGKVITDDRYRGVTNAVNGYKSLTYGFANASTAEGADRCVLIIAPVGSGVEQSGHLIAMVDLYDLLRGSAYEYVRSKGACYLTNKAGDVLATEDENHLKIVDGDVSFMNRLIRYSDNSPDARSSISDMKRIMLKYGKIDTNMGTSTGSTICILGNTLSNSHDIYLFVCYDEDEQLVAIKPMIFRSVLTCIIIILLMICLIIYVWATGKSANIMIEKLAYEDIVTKGRNGNYFRDRALQIIGTNRETPFIAQRFDICNFRYINEAYGHNKADELLTACINLANEIFDEKELCVRMDSDQFITLNINDSSVDQKRDNYIVALNEYARSMGVKYPIRLKFGVYQIRKQDLDIDLIIDRANVARKSLDGDEKKLIAYYSDALVQDMRKTDKIESEMQKAMESGEFKVFLQPKWNIVDDCLYGAEALVRWIKLDGTVVFPGSFIPVFEKNGFIEKLDFYMLESVCRIMQKRIEKGQAVCPVSINQSRLLMHNPEYINNVAKVLKNHAVPRKYIELELTETVFFDNRNKMIEMMNQLKEQHVSLSMDDFGSGYSSLNLLKDIPFDVLKIDKEFFSEATTSEVSKWILQKIVEMAEGLGIEVICEGVETSEQIEMLKAVGCRYVQGYYYSKPIPYEEFMEKYLNDKTVEHE